MNARASALLLRAALAEAGPITMSRVSALCVRGCIQLLATCATLAALQPLQGQGSENRGSRGLPLPAEALAAELAAAVAELQPGQGEESDEGLQLGLRATFSGQLRQQDDDAAAAVWADPPCLPLGTATVLRLGLPAGAAAGAPRPQRARVLLESRGAVLLDTTLALPQGQAVLR